MKKIAIIGGGAAGMMACATICENDFDGEIFLIEKNPVLGKKVLLTGGGRCNVTTGLTDLKEILKKYLRGHKFLQYAMYEFSPQKVREWFFDYGLRTKVEKDMRVFPASGKSEDVVNVFEKIFKKHNVNILISETVESVKKSGNGFEIKTNKRTINVDKVILTTGGRACEIAESFGHKITKFAPSLSGLKLSTSLVPGIGIQDALLKLRFDQEKYEYRGPFVFTHDGVSGPCVFALSAMSAYSDFGDEKPAKLFIDFVPSVSREEVLKDIKNQIGISPKKEFSNTLAKFLPKSLTIEFRGKNVDVGKNEINKAVEHIKNRGFTVVGRISGNEFVTAGGIDLSEVDPKTMQSKICPGLFFGGEVLDVDGFTGGFNLQAAWATGRIAGKSIVF